MLSSRDISELSKLPKLLPVVNDLLPSFLITARKLHVSFQSSPCVFDKMMQFTYILYDMWKRPTGLLGHSTWIQCVSDIRTGKWEELLLETVEHT